MFGTSVAHFYNGSELKESKVFCVSSDDTLYYMTVANAREYGDANGYDGFSMDGDAYSLKDGKMIRIVCDTNLVDIDPADETEFTRFIKADFAKEVSDFAACVADITDAGDILKQ